VWKRAIRYARHMRKTVRSARWPVAVFLTILGTACIVGCAKNSSIGHESRATVAPPYDETFISSTSYSNNQLGKAEGVPIVEISWKGKRISVLKGRLSIIYPRWNQL